MLRLALFALSLAAAPVHPGYAAAPIFDASTLNIGLNCQWQQSCIREHRGAKKRALKYVAKYKPPAWRVELCNRNARRGTLRVDWVGFDHCIRNVALSPALPVRKKLVAHR